MGWIGYEQIDYPFQLFSFSHTNMILITIALLLAMFFFRKKIQSRFKEQIRYMLFFLLVWGELAFHGWYLYHKQWDMLYHLPLQLCSISLYLCMIMLWTRNYRLFEVTFFVSMTGAVAAIITPELFFGFPHIRFFQFFIAHIAIVLSCFYMVWIEEFKATFHSVIKAFLFLNFIAAVVFSLNMLLGTNYMFLANKPSNTSIMDLLGPYPWYLLSLELVAFFLFSLLYLLLFKSFNQDKVKKRH